MTKTVETSVGQAFMRNVMIDVDGCNLEEGVEIILGGEYIQEFVGHVDLEDEEEVERLLIYFDLI